LETKFIVSGPVTSNHKRGQGSSRTIQATEEEVEEEEEENEWEGRKEEEEEDFNFLCCPAFISMKSTEL
jgi:hypothetical protein